MSELTLDVFAGDGFSSATLTGWVNENVPYVPGFIGSLPQMFLGEGVYTPDVQFDDRNGQLVLIQTSERGAPAQQSTGPKGTLRTARAVRLAIEAEITADQVLKVRPSGSAGVLKTAQQLVYDRVDGPFGIKQSHAMTREHMFLGAIDGTVYDADGSTVLWDYFSFYGQSRTAGVSVAFDSLTADGSVFSTALNGAKRKMTKALNGLNLASAIPVCLCGDSYYDKAWGNKEATAARKIGATGAGKNEAIEAITGNNAFDSFVYNKILFVNYRGTDDGKVAVPDTEGRLFMAGVPGLFNEYFAPADTMEFVGTKGLPSYILRKPENQTSYKAVFEVQSNPLPVCMRPKHLLRMTYS